MITKSSQSGRIIAATAPFRPFGYSKVLSSDITVGISFITMHIQYCNLYTYAI